MPIAKITSKNQLTIPKEIRDSLGLKSGSKVNFFMKKGQCIVEPANVDIKDLKGIIPMPKSPVTLQAMDKAIRNRKHM